MSYKQKYQELKNLLKAYDNVTVAFSGGVDSSLLLFAALDALGRENVTAATIYAPFHSAYEFSSAKEQAAALNCRQVIIEDGGLLDNPDFCANPPDRCYLCKKVIFSKLLDLLNSNKRSAVVDGSNVDDLQDYRPGMRAVKELQIASPLQQAGLTKKEIRLLSKEFGLLTWSKPSAPCLCSRIPYGSVITPKKLRQVEHGEDLLRQLGFYAARLRHHENLARIEIPPDRIKDIFNGQVLQQVRDGLRKLGFHYVTLDLHGFRSGSLNETL